MSEEAVIMDEGTRGRVIQRVSRTVCGFMFVLFISIFVSGCGTLSRSKKSGPASFEERSRVAVERTTEDERQAPLAQKEMNALFFEDKKKNPGGAHAFSHERLHGLEGLLVESKSPAIRYFLANREYFDQVEDSGGGFRVSANGKRLVPFAKSAEGRKKLFAMDSVRVREMIANPCFAALEDCGEYASDGVENLALLEQWAKKYPEREFRSERKKLIDAYLLSLDRYEAKFKSRGTKRVKKAAEIVQPHRARVRALK
jgi:hypothetical protein